MSSNIADTAGKIQGVAVKECRNKPDDRGSFTEVFRSHWAPDCNYSSEIQLNLSKSVTGALRGLHFHHKQYDWWIPLFGEALAVLSDLRVGSPTYLRTEAFKLSADESVCILIPPGVAHGFSAITDFGLLYAVDRYYDGTDEQGVAWNDPDIGTDWGPGTPILSSRDMNNPTVAELQRSCRLPVYSSQS